jgi:hypothetical protein
MEEKHRPTNGWICPDSSLASVGDGGDAVGMPELQTTHPSPVAARSIRHWPAPERPREKLLQRGATALSDAELLALLFGTGLRGVGALDLARQLLNDFGSLRGLLAADRDRVLAAAGLGPARVALLQGALELARRH